MKVATYQVDEKKILDKIFTFLVESGLENISVRELCKGTGIAQGSLYYWFEDKTEIICEATEYGLKKVTDEIFDYVFESISDLPKFFEECMKQISCYKKELRFIYQMAASPGYGQKIRKDGKYFKYMYERYADKVASILECDNDKVKPIVYLFVSAVCDYAIWEDENNAKTEIDFIYSILPYAIGDTLKTDMDDVDIEVCS